MSKRIREKEATNTPMGNMVLMHELYTLAISAA